MKILAAVLALILILLLAKSLFFSFRAQRPSDYAGTGPAFEITRHLSGEILSEGLVFGPTGTVTTSFTARMYGEWQGDTGTLTEEFTYSNGRKQNRKWYLKLGTGNRFTATADDIIGEAEGEVSGATLRLTYVIVLPPEAGGHQLTVTDWLYLTESGVILNRSELRKFGVRVAELVATMRPAGG